MTVSNLVRSNFISCMSHHRAYEKAVFKKATYVFSIARARSVETAELCALNRNATPAAESSSTSTTMGEAGMHSLKKGALSGDHGLGKGTSRRTTEAISSIPCIMACGA